jgi:hypothetical protein
MRVSETLTAMAREVQSMEVELSSHKSQDHDTANRYYYGKGSLDFRDKLLKLLGQIPKECTAETAFEILRATFPDPYPGK